MTNLLALNSIRGKSGKDTLIGLLESEGRRVFRVAFADVLKRMCAEELAGPRKGLAVMFERDMHSSAKDKPCPGLAIEELGRSAYTDFLKSRLGSREDFQKPRSLRWHLQTFGTQFHREFLGKPNVWFELGMLEVRKALEAGAYDHVVVTDMRMVNEYEGLLYAPAIKTIRIVRDWFIPGVDDQPYHISDIALMAHPFDALVVNRLGEPWAMLDQLKDQGVIE
ncbi:hypothetical protein [Pseudomonas rubra]|uniref:Deoxynucleotide monophosphate kinase n=1 Tax=Pseudomonas rubra TaxID=2942627 RepID=A0ABT5P6E9_9PSED|nr:hypothetical protein [Pseudomonas rubra]MDD1013871.1 hypothetical protein [Pseudomonas rubra]MDD1038308.1 hypothetical protein [Pseudomonas rubra]MDD1154602.1 hypothetical protein [Pseudomonas rubra]